MTIVMVQRHFSYGGRIAQLNGEHNHKVCFAILFMKKGSDKALGEDYIIRSLVHTIQR